jgi:hypothetical protein
MPENAGKELTMIFLHPDEISAPIEGFDNYEVTNQGRVFNIATGRVMVLSPTMNGDLTVGLVRDHKQHRYSVKGLVAREFVPRETEFFNTPILLDGDKYNLCQENIVWRPRWFAWMYTRQLAVDHPWYHFGPIVDTTTNTRYESFIAAAMANGLLCNDIKESIYSGLAVFPTYQKFKYAN